MDEPAAPRNGDADDDPGSVEAVDGDGSVPTAETTEERVARLRRVSSTLDSAVEIPYINVRVGLDPLLGVLPVVGDATATAASAYIVVESAALGVPRATLARMCLNLLVDAVVGSIPLVGDAFDVVWRANDRNVRLLDARLDDPDGERRDRRVVAALGVALLVFLLAVGAGVGVAVWWLLRLAGLV